MRIRSISFALAAAVAFAAPAAAHAAAREGETIGVEYKDLDLTTAAGEKELERRLDRAAREVCGMNETTVGSRVTSRQSRECYREARQQLGDQVSRLVRRDAAG